MYPLPPQKNILFFPKNPDKFFIRWGGGVGGVVLYCLYSSFLLPFISVAVYSIHTTGGLSIQFVLTYLFSLLFYKGRRGAEGGGLRNVLSCIIILLAFTRQFLHKPKQHIYLNV